MKKILITLLALALLLTSCNMVKTPPEIPDETENPCEEVLTEKNEPDLLIYNGIGGGILNEKLCVHEDAPGNKTYFFAYHSIPGVLIEYVGRDSFNIWLNETESQKKSMLAAYYRGEINCPYHTTIVDFVNDFNITRDVFEILLSSSSVLPYDFNLDAIYAGKDVAEKYYAGDRSNYAAVREALYYVKFDLYLQINNTKSDSYTSWIEMKNENGWYGTSVYSAAVIKLKNEKLDTSILPQKPTMDISGAGVVQYSLVELIHAFDVSYDEVKSLFSKYLERSNFTGTVDLDAMFAADFDEEYFKTTHPLDIDIQYFTFEENTTN